MSILTPHTKIISLDSEKLCVPTCDILRYSGCREQDDERMCALAKDALRELADKLTLRAVYAEVPMHFEGDEADFGFFKTESSALRKFLGGNCTTSVFAATIGIGADRLIAKYSPILPSRAVIIDGAATAAIECLCDYICSEIFGIKAQARFSPGYGDLTLEMQPEILKFLNTSLNIGLSMTDSMLLTPTKSVTAIAKLKD